MNSCGVEDLSEDTLVTVCLKYMIMKAVALSDLSVMSVVECSSQTAPGVILKALKTVTPGLNCRGGQI